MRPTPKNIILNNCTIALAITAVLILFANPVKKKFLVKLDKTESFSPQLLIYYSDLDNDGNSEKIEFQPNLQGFDCIKIFNPSHIGQFNSKTYKPARSFGLSFSDFDNNGIREIYFTGIRNDSIFINQYIFRESVISEFFIEKLAPETDFVIYIENLADLNNDGFKDILLTVKAGYKLQPRKIYLFDIAGNTLRKSPFTGAKPQRLLLEDLNNDGKKEIITGTNATKNYKEPVAYTDSFSWILQFDQQLQIKNAAIISKLKTTTETIIIENQEEKYILGLLNIKEKISDFQKYVVLDSGGKTIVFDSIPLGLTPLSEFTTCPVFYHFNNNKELLLLTQEGTAFKLDENFKAQKIKQFSGIYYPRHPISVDLNQDGKNETVIRLGQSSELVFFDPELKHFAKINLQGLQDKITNFGLLKGNSNFSNFYFQSGNNIFFITYRQNPLWNFRFLIWAAIFGGVYALVWLISYIQKERLKSQLQAQQQIRELQFRAITSQLNPHFTFNAINTLSSEVYNPEKPEIYDRFTTFSRLIRSVLGDSDKIARPLKNEISFTEDFLKIQKMRFKEAFGYEFIVDTNVDLSIPVPKLIIQVFVENAIKHAFPNNIGHDKLLIRISENKSILNIEIEDNGIGRIKAQENVKNSKVQSTGTGLKAIRGFVDLLNKQNQHKIRFEMVDLYTGQFPAGTLVKISIPVNFRYTLKG